MDHFSKYADDDEEEAMEGYDEEEEEVESDLIVVAKFARLAMKAASLQQQQENASAMGSAATDPAEIDISEEAIKRDDSVKEEEESTSSDEESSSASENEGQNVGDDDNELEGSGDDEDEPVKSTQAGPLTKNEIPYGMAPLDPLPDQSLLKPEDNVIQALKVTAVQSNMLVASSLGSPVLDSGSVVCDSNRVLIGRIDDVFGPVVSPFYTVRIMAPEPRPSLAVGDVLSWVEKFSYIVNCAALDTRGTDASNLVDEEVVDSEDDEDEEDMESLEEEDGFSKPIPASNTQQAPRFAPGNRGTSSQQQQQRGRSQRGRGPRSSAGRRGGTEQASRHPRPATSPISQAPIRSFQTQPQPLLPVSAAPLAPPPPATAALPPGWPAPRLPAGWPAPRY